MTAYPVTIAIIFSIMLGGIAVERLYRGFAARNPQLGPFRDSSKCGSCAAGKGCSADSCASDGAESDTTSRH